MTFEDEARRIRSDLLYLVPGNLREKSKYFRDRHGISVPYSSYDSQWSSLVSQLGVVDAARNIVECYAANLDVKAEGALRRAAREPISQRDIEQLDLWFVVDPETRRASDLGLFVLKYAQALFQEAGRLSAVRIYQVTSSLTYLLQARPGDPVVFEDGSAVRHGDCRILGHLRMLERLLGECRLAPLEYERLGGFTDSFEKYYCQGYAMPLREEDHSRLLRIVEKIEAAVSQELVNRDFSELRPVTGILDYKKLPSQLLDGLLGDIAYSLAPLVRQDLEEAIKCLRFGAPTASVMVGLRAVEGWLRELYARLTGQKARKGWSELLKEINAILTEKGLSDAPVIGFLNYVRDVRNRADHPDTVFEQVEAEQMFVAATTAITQGERLTRDLGQRP